MEESRKRNPKIILDTLAWGAPGWIGGGHFYSPDMAQYTVAFLRGAQREYGLDIAYTGIWNEKPYDASYVKELHRVLVKNGQRTKIVCCDMYPNKETPQWSIVGEMSRDAALNRAVDVVAVHYPRENGKVTTSDAARKSGKPVWSSEDQPDSSAIQILSRDWKIGGRSLAKLYNRNYLEGAFTKTEIWSPVTSYYDISPAPNSGLMYANTPWSGHYNVQGAIWATAHTTQFAQPGWQYLDSASGYLPEQGSYVALKSRSGKDWSVVVETIDAKNTQQVNFQIKSGLSNKTVHVWETNGQKTFEHVADLDPARGEFSFRFDPDSLYSLTTTSGQGRGSAEPPPERPFPFPYRESFEETPLNRAPHFLSDQDGAFEVHECVQRAGRCLEQVIADKPIRWDPLPDPWTLAGDVNWKDYAIAVDVLLPSAGSVTLMGRIDSADAFRDDQALWPSGYVLEVKNDGAWRLMASEYKTATRVLASGSTGAFSSHWHRAELKFQEDRITAVIDAHDLAVVRDSSHRQGMFGIGTGWNHAQFDNLSVAAIQ
jgi:hypothetical protein